MIRSKKKILLICEDCLSRNYSFTKSSISQKDRLAIKKFCQTCNQHTLHKESR
ncbi:50S ribosomal protein L33 [Spiroplasma sp. TIUS-1]|uniref:50S ribosomal protein L33 n=1 Tax=Spiroplasma sp. TIUS-1 TaxID=216963 RepID=UPI0013A703A6|nr:50S ribosomal protein L33 [Spiroplasma sp. TIUS-1]